MSRSMTRAVLAASALLLGTTLAFAQSFGTAPEAHAMLEKAVAALTANQAEALQKFNSPVGGFRDRDLYVFCFHMPDGKFTAHVNPSVLGTDIHALKARNGFPFGERIFAAAKEGAIATVDYQFPKPGAAAPSPKESFVTRVGDQGCGVGYYK
jgi:cytochrome c